MKKEKLDLALQEVAEEIEAALSDPRGLVAHQRRLAFCVSFGSTVLLELYFQKLKIIKDGARINHLWFKKKEESVFEILAAQIVSPIESVPAIREAIGIIIDIEEKRDDLAYGAPASESLLQEKINLFFKLREVLKC